LNIGIGYWLAKGWSRRALLLGALLIFGMLAVLMLVTRKVDWYALSRRVEPASVAAPEAQAP